VRRMADARGQGWGPGVSVSAQEGYRQGLLHRAGMGVPWPTRGRGPIERLTPSRCTDLAVRTHVPVVIDLHVVLVPMADADQVMRAIGRAVWPDDPSPLEEIAHWEGSRDADELFDRIEAAVHVLKTYVFDDAARKAALGILTGMLL